jgi:hypothetical protein
VHVN